MTARQSKREDLGLGQSAPKSCARQEKQMLLPFLVGQKRKVSLFLLRAPAFGAHPPAGLPFAVRSPSNHSHSHFHL
jgi:hypothetical protein